MNYEQQENRLDIFKRDAWTCKVCGNRLSRYGTPQLAHIIPQSKMYMKKYGKEVIHHRKNMVSTCCLKCNAAVSINGKDLLIEKKVAEIQKCIDKDIH